MSAYGERGRARWIVVPLGVVLIVAPILYGVLTLISPLPETRVVQTGFTEPTPFEAVNIPLPERGASAVVGPDGTLLGTSGPEEPVPMAGAAKTLLVLASLEARPLEGEDGEVIAITALDVQYFRELAGTGARVNRVQLGSTWTQAEVIRAVMVGGSNNHAQTLARWAFGSEEEYLAAIGAWAEENGLPSATVVDPTGLSAENTATAADLARLAWLAGQSPALQSILTAGAGGRGGNPVTDNLSYRTDAGITAISRGYTDAAGVCLLFSVPLADAGDEEAGRRAVYAAFLGQPDYPSLSASVDDFVAVAPGAIAPVTVVEEGAEVAVVESDWGQTATLVAARTVTVLGFAGELPPGRIDAVPAGFPVDGQPAGNLLLDLGGETERVGLRSDGSIRDPGILWRVTHPGELLNNLFSR